MTNEILKDEILSDDQLDQVAGGSWGESVGDYLNAFDRKIPGFDKIDPKSADGAIYLLQNWTEGDNVVGKLEKMFASHGITMTYNGKPFDPNSYSYNGKSITQDEAWKIIDGK
ncbi:MAG: hypothetical protein IJ774_14875 [Selenomonadaceae bacterium]|nr:hypothetical protein [Selenomonadaceae bacterium]